MPYLDVIVPLRIDEHTRDIRPKYLRNDVSEDQCQRDMDWTVKELYLPDGFPSREFLEQNEADGDSRIKMATRSRTTDLDVLYYSNTSNRLCD